MAMTLRLTDDQDRMLTLMAEREKITKGEAAARAIVERAERVCRDDLIRSWAAEIIERDQELLAMLGNA